MTVSFPDDFLWGVAAAAHQIEGGNSNNDWWAFEHQPDTPCTEPSGDACDSYHRYAEDVALVRDLGFAAYRFSIEWSRIEPEAGEFSRAALDYYRRVIAECHEQGVTPVVTLHHFSNPRWVAELGGWESPKIVDLFGRYCERTVAHLGDLIAMACTINEPNVVSLIGYALGAFPPGKSDMSLLPLVNDNLKAAHRRAVDALKSGRGDFPVGSCISMEDWWAPEGAEEIIQKARALHEDQHLEATRGDDFVGVQAYSRTRLSETGRRLGPEEGVPLVPSMGYEFWPPAIGAAIRHAADVTDAPIYVTENGLGHDDDALRIEYVRGALESVGQCLSDGIGVHGYFYWSLLDNYEWAYGYKPKFGLAAVDRESFVRTPKPSASWLGAVAKANRLDA